MTTTLGTSPASLAEQAYLALRDRLIMLEIAPGEPLQEGRIAEELGVGRTPVREAIKHLELDVVVDNAIPLGLVLSVKPLDQNGDPITGLTLPEGVEINAAPNSDNAIQSTHVTLNIEEVRENALQELDKLEFKVEGSNQDNHDVTLRPDQFIVVHLSARLPEGAQMDLEDL